MIQFQSAGSVSIVLGVHFVHVAIASFLFIQHAVSNGSLVCAAIWIHHTGAIFHCTLNSVSKGC